MLLSACRYANPNQKMPHSQYRASRACRNAFLAPLLMLVSFAMGCTGAPQGTNANSSSKPDGNANANAGPSMPSSQSVKIDTKEPERYSVAMTISIQQTASEAPAPMSTQQLSLARLDADRRWAFVFPAPLGQIVYLEKSGLKYLVLFERKLYVEITTEVMGFELGNVLTPNSIAERLKSRQYERLGLEPVNGRTAIKYRLAAAGATLTHTDGMIFVDQETGLPLRSELNTTARAGTKSRVIVEVRDVQLNSDRAQFDVPAGMKKVSQQEARQQIEGFTSALRSFADIISGTQSTPVANANRSATNKNAARSGQ